MARQRSGSRDRNCPFVEYGREAHNFRNGALMWVIVPAP